MSNHDAPRRDLELAKGFQIEDWLVQPQLNRITRDTETVQIQPKIMAVLVCLAEEPGTVVLREKLFKTVWAETYVTEHVLARSISVLRKVFADKPQNPRVIETIPKVGYRLIALVSKVQDNEQPATEREADWDMPQMTPVLRDRTGNLAVAARTMSWSAGLWGLLFLIIFFMVTGHGHFHH